MNEWAAKGWAGGKEKVCMRATENKQERKFPNEAFIHVLFNKAALLSHLHSFVLHASCYTFLVPFFFFF